MVKRMAFATAFAAALAAIPFAAFAATLSIAPGTMTVNAGSEFAVQVVVSSPDQAINAASGVLSFPSDELQAVGLSKNDSIMTFWVQNPSFSNDASGGTANFAGVLLNPGWTGSAGTVITVEFQALAPGNAQIAFATGTVLANDGNGTDVLTAMNPADITIVPAPPGAPSVTTTTAPPTSTTTPTSTPVQTPSTSTATSTPAPITPPSHTLEYLAMALLMLLLIIAILLFLIVLYLWMHRSAKKGAAARDKAQLREDLKNVAKDIEHLEKDLTDPKE